MTPQKQGILASEKGFTLIEIIAVLVILGILSAVAVPKFIDLQTEAREKSAMAAISEVKARLSMAYAQYLLKNGTEPANIAAVCGANGVNDATILPLNANGAVNVGSDYTVRMTNVGLITVTHVQGKLLSPAITSTWTLP